MSNLLNEAREALTGALNEFETAVEAISTHTDGDSTEVEARCATAEVEVERRSKIVKDLEKISEAREKTPVIVERSDIKVGREEATYRPDAGTSFFRDLALMTRDADAGERIRRHNAETRNVTSVSNGFIPPVYLAGLAADVPRAGRAFADALPKAALPATGQPFPVPRLAPGVTVAAQTEGAAISNTDSTTDTVTVPVRTIAGNQNISQQLLDRSDPAFDSVIYRDLVRAYDAQLNFELLHGTAAAVQHLGIANVTSINTVTYTSSTPTGVELLPKLYDAIQKVASTRFSYPTMIVMHPRRAAALAAASSSSVPLFQQGGLFRAAGEQDKGFAGTIAGLPVIADPTVTTTNGVGTNQDQIFVIYSDDLVLMEGSMRLRALDAPLSSTLEVRLQAFAYSAFLSARYPSGITAISGTGLVTPSF